MGVLHDSQDAGFVMSSAETVEKISQSVFM